MAGPIRARWFDPATGNYLAISDGYELANEHSRSFTTPAVRGDGTDDWVLVLDSTGNPRCGTITADGVYTAPASIPDGIDCQVTATLKSDPSVVARAEPIREVQPAASQPPIAHGAESSAAPQPGDEVWTRRDRWSR